MDYSFLEVTEKLKSRESVKLTGFETFEIREKQNRMGRNPKTGEHLLIRGHKTVVFRPTKDFWEMGEES